MRHAHLPPWDIFRLREYFRNLSQKGPSPNLAIFSSSPLGHGAWRLACVFSGLVIYIETYVYDDVYVHVLMT